MHKFECLFSSFSFSPNIYIHIIHEIFFLFLECLSLPRSRSGHLFIFSWWCNHSSPASPVLTQFCPTLRSTALLSPNFVKSHYLLRKFGSTFSFWIADFFSVSLMVWTVLSSRSKISEAYFHWDEDSPLFRCELVYGPTLQRYTHLLIMHFKNLIAFNGAKKNM